MGLREQRNCPFLRRVRFETRHVEALCAEALASVGLLPKKPAPVRIERFPEKYFRAKLRFRKIKDDALGSVQFDDEGRVVNVFVSKTLAQDETLEGQRKVRSTIAHECGHGLLHGELFAERLHFERHPRLLADHGAAANDEFLNLEVVRPGTAPRYEWWEFQANMAMSALLLPRKLVTQAALPFARSYADAGPGRRDAVTEQAANELAEVFDVNPVMIRFRLADWWTEALQLRLL